MTQQQGPEILAEQSSDVSLQGTIIRNRVPTNITVAAGGEPGDAIEWQVLKQGNVTWISGVVAKGAAKGKTTPTRTAAPAKAASKKSSAKKVTKPSKGKPTDLDSAFGEEENWADDAPNLGVTPPTIQKPAKVAAAPVITAPARKGAGGGRYQVPTRK
jgi:hypothetical protein